MAFIMVAIVAVGGPVVYFGLRRYFRWMQRMADREEARDEAVR